MLGAAPGLILPGCDPRRCETHGPSSLSTLDRIQQANPDSLAGIFGDIQWGYTRLHQQDGGPVMFV